MRAELKLIGSLVLGLLCVGFVERGLGAEPPEGTALATALIEAHNEIRSKANLPPLRANAQLEEAARVHARDMAEHAKMSHDGSDGSTPFERMDRAGYPYDRAGENVARGQNRAAEVMRGWMNSPPHKEHILGDFSEIGAACVEAEDGTPYWCVEFGKPWPTLDAAKAETTVIEMINRERKKLELPSLKVHPRLKAAAEQHAKAMAERGKLEPDDGKADDTLERIPGPNYRNVTLSSADAAGQATPEDVLKNWLGDEGLRKHLLGRFRDIGVGYASDKKGRPFWSLILGRPMR